MLLRRGIWFILACCAVLDGVLGEAAISGYEHAAFVRADQKWAFPQAQPELWLPIMGFVAIQGFLVFVLIRLRHADSRISTRINP